MDFLVQLDNGYLGEVKDSANLKTALEQCVTCGDNAEIVRKATVGFDDNDLDMIKIFNVFADAKIKNVWVIKKHIFEAEDTPTPPEA